MTEHPDQRRITEEDAPDLALRISGLADDLKTAMKTPGPVELCDPDMVVSETRRAVQTLSKIVAPPPEELREQVVAAFGPFLVSALSGSAFYGPSGKERLGRWVEWIADAVMSVIAIEAGRLAVEQGAREAAEQRLSECVTVHPDVMVGQATVGGSRVLASTVAGLVPDVGEDGIADYYPSVTPAGARAAVRFVKEYVPREELVAELEAECTVSDRWERLKSEIPRLYGRDSAEDLPHDSEYVTALHDVLAAMKRIDAERADGQPGPCGDFSPNSPGIASAQCELLHGHEGGHEGHGSGKTVWWSAQPDPLADETPDEYAAYIRGHHQPAQPRRDASLASQLRDLAERWGYPAVAYELAAQAHLATPPKEQS